MVYLKEDEKIHKKFEEDNTILQAQSNGQEALIDNFQCYKTGYNRGKADERQKVRKILDDLWDTEATDINSGVYAYPFEAMRDMIIKALDRVD